MIVGTFRTLRVPILNPAFKPVATKSVALAIGIVLQSLNLNFRAPVIPPELLKVVVEITGISVSVNQLRLSVNVYRSDGVHAVSGEARTIVGRTSPV